MEKIIKSIATLGIIGYAQAPGTAGSLCVLPYVYVFCMLTPLTQAYFMIALACISYYIIALALPYFDTPDPSEIVLDEVVGCLITFIAIPFSWTAWFTGFILFRVFDVLKPFGIKHVEKLPGAWGVLLDDVVAGLCANIILRLLFL